MPPIGIEPMTSGLFKSWLESVLWDQRATYCATAASAYRINKCNILFNNYWRHRRHHWSAWPLPTANTFRLMARPLHSPSTAWRISMWCPSPHTRPFAPPWTQLAWLPSLQPPHRSWRILDSNKRHHGSWRHPRRLHFLVPRRHWRLGRLRGHPLHISPFTWRTLHGDIHSQRQHRLMSDLSST